MAPPLRFPERGLAALENSERIAEVPIADSKEVCAVLGPVKGRLRRPRRKASAAAPLTIPARRRAGAATSAMGTTASGNSKAIPSPSAIAEGSPHAFRDAFRRGSKEGTALRSVGLDLGKKEVAYCEVQDGKVVARRTARGIEELDDLLGPQSPATVAIEACREAWHVHDRLTKYGHKLLLIDTTRVKQLGVGHHGRKRDNIDAEVIAFAVDRQQIPQAHLLSPHRRELREKIHARRALVETRATYVTMMRGIIRARGEKLASCDTEHFRATLERAVLTREARGAIAPLMAVLETIDIQLSSVEAELEELAAKDATIAHLTSAPGVDLIVASVFVSVIDEAKRFPDAHKVASYLGLVPREDTTGGRDKQKLGSITKCGNPHARAMLVQAAWCILRGRGGDPLRTWARQIEKRRGRRITAVAVARRLAGVLWAMWRDGQTYDPSRLGTASARGLKAAARDTEAAAGAMRTIAMKAAKRMNRIGARLKADPTKLKPTAATTATKEVAR